MPPSLERKGVGSKNPVRRGPWGRRPPAPGMGPWGLLRAGFLQARNNCLSATAQLPRPELETTPGDQALPPWERGLELQP